MSSKIFLDRIRNVFKQNDQVDAIVIEKPVDLFYLTGLNLSAGVLLISATKACLFVDGRYIGLAERKAPCACGLLNTENLKQALHPFSQIGFDSSATSYKRWQELKKLSKQKLIPLQNTTETTRAVKTKEELKWLKKSAALLWKGYQHLRKILKAGMTEKEAAIAFELFCLKHGAEKMAFDPIIAFGKNSAFPHYRAGNTRLKKGDVVLIDIGVVVDHYHSDMTRTFFFGKPDPRLILFQETVQKAHDAALALCRPGSLVGELDEAACQVIKQAGLQSYLAHSLGHGVGLEIHEFPRLKYQGADHHVRLKAGMVITIEPGLYQPGVGGYRFEDTIVITKDGYENWYP